MPAYKKNLDRRCPCGQPARYEVFNTYNASLGGFCGRCADREVARLNVTPVRCPDCGRTDRHIHCPECGSTEHVASTCDNLG